MKGQVPTYSHAEKERRWNLARDLMKSEGLEALIVYGEREGAAPGPYNPDTFFTNDRPGSIVVFPRDEEPITLVFAPMVIEDHIQAAYRNKPGWIQPKNIYVGKTGTMIVEILKKKGLDNSPIGVIGLEPYPPFYFDGAPMPYNTWKTVLENLPNAIFKPVARKFFGMTMVKSQEEIEVLKWSAQVGEKMCEAMLETTKPGVAENDIYAAAIEACPQNVGFVSEILLGSGHEFVGWGPPTWTYRPEQPRIIKEGDIVLAEVFSSLGMLETQHQPAIAVGNVHLDFEKAAEVARQSYENGLEYLKPGNKFGQVVEAMTEPLQEAGGWEVHPLIHSINPYGLIGFGTDLARLPEGKNYGKISQIPNVGQEVELKPGMTFAFEPNCAFGRRVVNIGGTVLVGEERAIELNKIATHLMRT